MVTVCDLEHLESLKEVMCQRWPAEVVERFWQKVTWAQACSCHVWEERCTGWTDALSHGYGRFSVFGKPWDAHRFLFDALYGPLPPDKFVLHTPPCVHRACIRHLYLGTPAQNSLDAQQMGRLATGERNGTRVHGAWWFKGENNPARRHPEIHQGERNGRATITADLVRAIRADRQAGMTLRDLEYKYAQCGTSCIHHIVAGHTWKHLL